MANLWTAEQAARELGLNPSTVRKLARRLEGTPGLDRAGPVWVATEEWWREHALVRTYRKRAERWTESADGGTIEDGEG